MEDNQACLLILIVDTDTNLWKSRSLHRDEKTLTFDCLIKQLIIFCNSYSLLNRCNELLILANHPNGLDQIFPPSSQSNLLPTLFELPSVIAEGLLKYSQANSGNEPPRILNTQSSLANALTTALCGEISFLLYQQP